MNDLSPSQPLREGFWSIFWHVVSSFAAGVLLFFLIGKGETGAAFIGLSILVAGHTIARAIRGYP